MIRAEKLKSNGAIFPLNEEEEGLLPPTLPEAPAYKNGDTNYTNRHEIEEGRTTDGTDITDSGTIDS